MIKRLMNVVTIVAISLFLIIAYGSMNCGACDKPASIMIGCIAAILFELVINYVVYSKITLWHKKQDM